MINRHSNLFAVGVCALLIVSTGPAQAASVEEWYTFGRDYTVQSFDTAAGYLGAAWGSVKSSMPGMPSARSFLEGDGEDQQGSELDFVHMMDVAGFATKSITVSVGLFPDAEFRFAQKRQISDYDLEYLHRLLRKHKRERSGPKAMAERAIINTVLEIQSFKKYDLTHMDVRLLPLPSVTFVAEPKDIVLDPDTNHVLRKIEQLNLKLEELSAR